MFKTITLRSLGGLNENEDPTSLRENDLTEADNTARLGILTGTRPGLAYDASGEYDTQIEGTPGVQGIFEWSIDRDATRNVVVVAGGQAWTGPTVASGQLDKTANSVSITSGVNNLWSFANHRNQLFAAGGALTDSFWTWDGTNDPDVVDVQNSAAQSLQPLYVFEWKNYLFLTGLRGRTLPDDNPLIWRYHNLGSDATDPANWPTSNTLGGTGIGGLSSYGTEFSTGTAQFADNNGSYLMLLSNKRIHSYVTDPNSLIGFVKNDEIANGCVSQFAYIDLGLDSGDAVYFSPVGIHSLRMSQQFSGRARAFLSWPIRKTFASLNRNRFQYVSGAYWPNEGIVAFSVSTSGSSVNDLIMAMDIQEAEELTPDTVRWYKWRVPASVEWSISHITFGRDSNNIPVIYVGTSDGRVGVFNRGAYVDFGTTYETAFTTKHDDFETQSVNKTVGDLHIVSRGNGTYQPTHQYVFDYGQRKATNVDRINFTSVPSVWDTAVFGTGRFSGAQPISRQKIHGYGSGQTIAHRFRHSPTSGANEPFFIASIAQQVSVTGESETATGGTQ